MSKEKDDSVDVPEKAKTVRPDKINTFKREEMVCTKCYTKKLEAHPYKVEDWDSVGKLFRATRCRNEECEYHGGVPEDVIERQFSPPTLVDKLLGRVDWGLEEWQKDDTAPVEKQKKEPKKPEKSFGEKLNEYAQKLNFLRNQYIAAALIIMVVLYLLVGVAIPAIIEFVSVPTTHVEGEVAGPNGAPLAEVQVSAAESEAKTVTNKEGDFNLTNVPIGNQTLLISPPNETGFASDSTDIHLEEDGNVRVRGNNTHTTLRDGKLVVALRNLVPLSQESEVSNDNSINVDFANTENLGDGVDITLAPVGSREATETREIKSGNKKDFEIPGQITSQSLRVTGQGTGVAISDTYQYNGGTDTFAIQGERPPSNMKISVYDELTTESQSLSRQVSSGEQATVSANNPTEDPAELTVSAVSESSEIDSGTWSGGSGPSVSLDSRSFVSMTVEGTESTGQDSVVGTVQNGQASFGLEGTETARNIEMEFTGGSTSSSSNVVASDTESSGGEGDTGYRSTQLYEATEDSTFELELDHTIIQNGDLVQAGYSINGDQQTVSTGTSTEQVSLNSGDTVSLWVDTSSSSQTSTKSFNKPSGSPNVVDTTVSSTNIEPGESINLEVTLENTNSDPYKTRVVTFKDGNSISEDGYIVEGNSRRTIDLGSVHFSQSGVHTVSVNEGRQVEIQVGNTDTEYGEGEISGDLVQSTSSGSGTIKVDTNSDGTTDCSVSSNDGVCTLPNMEPGQHSVTALEENVDSTGFIVTYTKTGGASDINIDMNNDGNYEINRQTLSPGETATGGTTMDSGSHTVRISADGNLDYTIETGASDSVRNVRVDIDGETIVNENEITSTESFELPAMKDGDNTFTFYGDSGYSIDIQWSETTEKTPQQYPTLRINSVTACQPNDYVVNTCRIDQSILEAGQNTINLDGTDNMKYKTEYTINTVPESVNVIINGQVTTIRKQQLAEQNQVQFEIQSLQSGNNTVSVTTEGDNSKATAALQYTYEGSKAKNPRIVVTDGQGNKNTKQIPDENLNEDGFLEDKYSFTLPAEWFSRGDNKIQVQSENNGVVKVSVNTQVAG